MKIGVFDSGVGGLSVANAIEDEFPDIEVLYRQDKQNLPYGTKTPDELMKFVYPILRLMEAQGCDSIVLACNTVSTTLIDRLRKALRVDLIGVEPMVEEASQLTKSNIIAVCATPTTLESDRYKELNHLYASEIVVLEPDCSEWANMIENDQIDREIIKNHITNVCEQGADVIVLGCTHYHWIERDIRLEAEKFNAKVIQPENKILDTVRQVLSRPS